MLTQEEIAKQRQLLALQRDHLEMMKRTELWPLKTVLPLRNRRREPPTAYITPANFCLGVLIAGEGPKILRGLLLLDLSILETEEPITYPDFEAVVADGWEVD